MRPETDVIMVIKLVLIPLLETCYFPLEFRLRDREPNTLSESTERMDCQGK